MTTKYFGDAFTVYLVYGTPRTILEAFASSDIDDWKEVVSSEMDSILSNETWELVDLPYGESDIILNIKSIKDFEPF
jgi:hypothetical protein